MSIVFSRTTRSLQANNLRRSSWILLLAVLLLAAWGSWFLFAEIAVLEVSQLARIEVDREVHNVQAPVQGRVVATQLSLGRRVKLGEVLIRLDDKRQRLQLKEAQTQLFANQSQLSSLRAVGTEEKNVLEKQRIASQRKIAELRVKLRSAVRAATIAEAISSRWSKLHRGGHMSLVELLRARSTAVNLRGTADSLRAIIRTTRSEAKVALALQQVKIRRERSRVEDLKGQIVQIDAKIRRLKYDISQRRILSPVAGRLGKVMALRVGSVLNVGDQIAAIVPRGTLKLVAYFPPETATGRIKPGQRAKLRLLGFSWAVYGTVPATVTRIATEPANRRVRVEFKLGNTSSSSLKLQHGLLSAVEIEIERVSPMVLILRAAGKLLTGGGEKQDDPDKSDR